MILKKKELYECLLNDLIVTERFEDCCMVRDYLPYIHADEYYQLDDDDEMNIEEYDLDDE